MGITSIPGFDSINTALIMTDSDGCIVYKNKAARKRYTRPAVGASLVRLISDDTCDDFNRLMTDGIPAVIRMREVESQNSYRAAAGPFTYCGADYLMLVFIDTLHLDPSKLLFAELYRQLPIFWEKISGLLYMLSENTVTLKSIAASGRFPAV